eukprot:CAMPEP_0183371256 /NCGR_PEP_ID=MMETSP0164_2-20130417/104827_1 /TAXON_ID=221442 /ORGANISM="Coccolithus pelagicus ssp braarudi, Strain PLY182g" /LENGTH=103 /DNA_ID=CAMNT_0025547771 /DNA_START=421 /DNA_END=728 /DNA_ORIENTATION=+
MNSGLLAMRRVRKALVPSVAFSPNAVGGTNAEMQQTDMASHDACKRSCLAAYLAECIETTMNDTRDKDAGHSVGVGTRIELGSSMYASSCIYRGTTDAFTGSA